MQSGSVTSCSQHPTDAYELLLSFMQKMNQLVPLQPSKLEPCEDSYASQDLLDEVREARDRFAEESDYVQNRLNHAHTLVRLYEFQSEQARKKVEAAEFCIGEMRARLRSRGLPIYRVQLLPANTPAMLSPPSIDSQHEASDSENLRRLEPDGSGLNV